MWDTDAQDTKDEDQTKTRPLRSFFSEECSDVIANRSALFFDLL